jgi:hypothetical protein
MRLIEANGHKATVETSITELFVCLGGIREAMQELEDGEFHTRMGVEKREAQDVLYEVIGVYRSLKTTGAKP